MSNIKISITGDLGSGKSTVCDMLASRLNLKKYSMGVLQRQLAAQYGMDTLEFNIYAEQHPEIDDEIDGNLRRLANVDEDIIVDSRMAWHFLPDTFKIFLTVDVVQAAKRIMGHIEKGGRQESYVDLDDAVDKINERKKRENLRYMKLYKADCANLSNFDLVIDSTDLTPEEVYGEVIVALKKAGIL